MSREKKGVKMERFTWHASTHVIKEVGKKTIGGNVKICNWQRWIRKYSEKKSINSTYEKASTLNHAERKQAKGKNSVETKIKPQNKSLHFRLIHSLQTRNFTVFQDMTTLPWEVSGVYPARNVIPETILCSSATGSSYLINVNPSTDQTLQTLGKHGVFRVRLPEQMISG